MMKVLSDSMAMRSLFRRPLLSGVPGMHSSRTSTSPANAGSVNSLSNSSKLYTSSKPSEGRPLLENPVMRFAPRALYLFAAFIPMSPVPMTAMLLPAMDLSGRSCTQQRAPITLLYSYICLISISVTIMMCSPMVLP